MCPQGKRKCTKESRVLTVRKTFGFATKETVWCNIKISPKKKIIIIKVRNHPLNTPSISANNFIWYMERNQAQLIPSRQRQRDSYETVS